ncbi:MAG: hypothetical protein R2706_12410 [Acidimicrobiales bacterium]
MSDRAQASKASEALSSTRLFWVVFSYLMPMCLAASTTFNWFRRGYFVASGDINPFLREGMASELGSLWNHQLSGAGSPSYDVARSLDVLIINAVGALGGSPATAQHVFTALLMAFASYGSIYFARAFTRSLVASAVVGVLGPINPFVLVLLPNPIFVLAIGVGGVLGGLIVRAAADEAPPFAVFALAILPVSYLSVNPPLLAVLVMWMIGLTLLSPIHGDRYRIMPAIRYLAKAAPFAILVSLWWIVPLYLTVLGGSESVQVAAQTDAAAWSWSHAENSIVNVVTLKAHWGWPYPEYYPYAARLDQGIWPALRLVFPLLAFSSVLLVKPKRRKTAAAFVGAVLILIFLAKGIHDPFKGVNLWLYEHVPGLWLLREPMSKVGPLIVLIYVALSAMTITAIIEWTKQRRETVAHAARAVLYVALFGAAMAPQPLWSGGVITADRGPLPSSHVQIPDDWYAVADAVNATPAAGKSILLPLNSYYQVTTSWGYHGVDSFFDQLTDRPTLQRLPGGYFSPPEGVDYLMATLEQRLIDGDAASVEPLMRSLGANNLVIRFDLQATSAPKADQVAEMVATAGAAFTDGPIINNSMAVVYNMPSAEFVRVLDTAIGTSSDNAPDGAPVAALPANAVAVSLDSVVDGVIWEPADANGSVTFRLANSQTLQASTGLADEPLRITSTGESPLQLASSDAIAIDNSRLFEPITLEFGVPTDDVVALQGEAPASPILLSKASAFTFDPGERVAALGFSAESVLGAFGPPENCARADDRTGAALGHIASASGTTVSLEAKAHAACIWAPIESPQPIVQLSFRYKSNGVARPRFCIWQEGPDVCAAAAPLRSVTEWTDYAALVDLDPTATSIRLFLYADGQDNGEATKTDYDQITVRPITTLATATVTEPVRQSVSLEAGDHELTVAGESQITNLTDVQPMEDCGRFDSRTAEEAALTSNISDEAITLSAIAHSACVWIPVPLPSLRQSASGSTTRPCRAAQRGSVSGKRGRTDAPPLNHWPRPTSGKVASRSPSPRRKQPS